MTNAEIVRAWKDPEYRSTLGQVPVHPAGEIELADPGFDRHADLQAAQFHQTHGHGCSTVDTSSVCCGTFDTGDVCCFTCRTTV